MGGRARRRRFLQPAAGGLIVAGALMLATAPPVRAASGVSFGRAPGVAVVRLTPQVVRRGGNERVVCGAVNRHFVVVASGGTTSQVEARATVELPNGASPDWCLLYLTPNRGHHHRIAHDYSRLGRRFLTRRAAAVRVLGALGVARRFQTRLSASRIARGLHATLVGSPRKAKARCAGSPGLRLFLTRHHVVVSLCADHTRLLAEQSGSVFSTNFLDIFIEITQDGD